MFIYIYSGNAKVIKFYITLHHYIIHFQLRDNASNLNADLNKDFIRDHPNCDSCGHQTENDYHCFL